MIHEAHSTDERLLDDLQAGQPAAYYLHADDIVNRFLEVRAGRPPRNIYIIDGSNIFYWDDDQTRSTKAPDWMWRRRQTQDDWAQEPYVWDRARGVWLGNIDKSVPHELEPLTPPDAAGDAVRDGDTWATVPDSLKGDVIVVCQLDTLETIRTHPVEVRAIIQRFAGTSDTVLFLALKPFLCSGVPVFKNRQEDRARSVAVADRPCFQKMRNAQCVFSLAGGDTDQRHKFCEYDDVFIAWITALLKERIAAYNGTQASPTGVKVITADRWLRFLGREIVNTETFHLVFSEVTDALEIVMRSGRMRFSAHYYDGLMDWDQRQRRPPWVLLRGLPERGRVDDWRNPGFAPRPPAATAPDRGFPDNRWINNRVPKTNPANPARYPPLWAPRSA